MITLVVFIAGLIWGSFLNVVIYRLPNEESLIMPMSRCPMCKSSLRFHELVPVLSYLLLKGKCSHCNGQIPPFYPAVELLTAIGFAIVFLKSGFSIPAIIGWIFYSLLIAASFIDIRIGIIPNKLTYPGIIIGIVLASFKIGTGNSIFAAVLFAAIFLSIAVISKGGIGGGDIKLAAVIGAFVGLQGIFWVFIISAIFGFSYALYMLLLQGADLKTAICYGPFLSLAGFVTFIWADEICVLYWGLFQ